MTPQTTFEPQPAYIPNNMIILTLDDGPDGVGCGGQSCTVLDNQFFMQNGIKADFFINTANRCEVAPMFGCYAYAQQLIAAGHYIANHTVHHYHLAPGGGTGDGIMHCSDATCVDGELSGVEQTVSMLTNGATPHLTRFRAPFGEPYQTGSTSDQMLVEPVVARYAVAVNWNFDSQDSNGMMWDGVSLFNNIQGIIQTPGKGAWGIMLMHAVYQWTHDMLPVLIPYLQKSGFQLATVEDAICWRFGKHSWQIIPGRGVN
jgi:peptidoglycan/xylan/chitin deacetylase (PgdA/CDA1 family)